jgi:hypothetical protein
MGLRPPGHLGRSWLPGRFCSRAIILGVILTLRTISAIQGFYYVATGLWPLVSLDTFVAVTGPKTDFWLVRTVSLLVICIGAALLLSAKMNRVTAPIVILAISAAACLGWVDANYSLRGIIWPVYMMDAFAEALLIVGWSTAYLLSRRRPR